MKTSILATLLLCQAPVVFAADLNDPVVNVKISAQIVEGTKPVSSYTLNTVSGVPAAINTGSNVTYGANSAVVEGKIVQKESTIKDGCCFPATPTVTKSGKLLVSFGIEKTDVLSIQNLTYGDLKIQLPRVSTSKLLTTVALNDGQEIAIPPTQSPADGSASHTYTLKLTANKQ